MYGELDSDACLYADLFTTTTSCLLLVFFFSDHLLNLPVVVITLVSKRVRENRHVYLAFLAVADTLVAFNGLLAVLWVWKKGFAEHDGMCTFFKIYLLFTLLLSLVTLFLVALDRLIFIQWPLFYLTNINNHNALVLMGSAWGGSFAYVFLMRFSDVSDDRFCSGQCDPFTIFYQSVIFAYANSVLFGILASMPFLAHSLICNVALFQARKVFLGADCMVRRSSDIFMRGMSWSGISNLSRADDPF
ncbi:hypothetical protein ACOMHN_037496 [Nucella lapillus]